jgi:hypothetical protein
MPSREQKNLKHAQCDVIIFQGVAGRWSGDVGFGDYRLEAMSAKVTP